MRTQARLITVVLLVAVLSSLTVLPSRTVSPPPSMAMSQTLSPSSATLSSRTGLSSRTVPAVSPLADAAPISWRPPPVDMTALPPDATPGPPPGITYTQKVNCIQPNTNDTVLPDEPAAQTMLNIRAAQRFSLGAGVKVAVIDTGVNPNHLLTDHNRLRGGGDYIAPSPTSNGTVDCDGHGTLTAGIVAANTANTAFGFTGVAPQATIYAIRQTSDEYDVTTNGQDTGLPAGTPATLAAAIVHAVHLGVNVITMSLNTCLPTATAVSYMNTPGSEEKQLQAAIHFAVENNVVVVNSAGNVPSQAEGGNKSGSGTTSPCASIKQNNSADPNNVQEIQIPAVYSNDLLSVGSVSPFTGAVSTFSVWGPWVNIAAPGEAITSVDPGQGGGTGLANLYAPPGSNAQPGPIQGTSFAAPYVAGVVALVRARFPHLSAREVMHRIEVTAQHPTGPDGRDNQVGYGIIDPVAALTAAIPGQNGVPAERTGVVPAQLPREPAKDWTPMRVALIGTAVGVVLLLGTLFVVRTVRRRRRFGTTHPD